MSGKNGRTVHRSFLFPFFLTLATSSLLSAWIFTTVAVAEAPARQLECRPFDLSSTERFWSAGGTECFEAFVPESGHLLLDVSAAGDAAGPALGLLEGSCLGSEAGAHRVVAQAAGAVLVEVLAPGHLGFCTRAPTTEPVATEHRLRSAFLGSVAHRGSDPNEDEPDPDPNPLATGCSTRGSDPNEDEPDPDPNPLATGCSTRGSDPNEDEPDPDPQPLQAPDVLAALCELGETDDHGDALLCATPVLLGHVVEGTISNAWGDDQDAFVFLLDERRTVEIELAGDHGLAARLYDRHGHRLASESGDGSSAGGRLVATLAPGPYVVQVRGLRWAEGPYRLSLREVPWP